MDKVDCVVIGAGVIGLAVARHLAQSGREVIVLEAAEGIGTVTSSRNSEVIHAGIYYRAGSLMAQMCVSGKRRALPVLRRPRHPPSQLRQADRRNDAEETEKLQSIRAHAEANGVDDMQLLDGETARALEPALNCDAALLSPSTGIIDSHAYMLALRGDAEEAGAAFAFHTPIERARARAGRIEIEAGGDDADDAGMRPPGQRGGIGRACRCTQDRGHADRVDPPAYLAKGNYFSCSARAPFSRLIYPVPEPGGLGVHLTLDHGRPGAVRARRGMGRSHRLLPSTRRAPTGSIPRSGAIGRRCRTAR